MNKRFPLFLFFSFSLLILHAQNYQLSTAQRDALLASKNSNKLGLGFEQLLTDPDDTEAFVMKDGQVAFIASPHNGADELMTQLQAAGAQNCAIVNNLVCGTMDPDQIGNMTALSALKFAVPEFRPSL